MRGHVPGDSRPRPGSPRPAKCFRKEREPIYNDRQDIVGERCPGCGQAWARPRPNVALLLSDLGDADLLLIARAVLALPDLETAHKCILARALKAARPPANPPLFTAGALTARAALIIQALREATAPAYGPADAKPVAADISPGIDRDKVRRSIEGPG